MDVTPLTLHSLDEQRAVFVGTAEEQKTFTTVFGEQTVDAKFPVFAISREHWDSIGRPVQFLIKASVVLPEVWTDR